MRILPSFHHPSLSWSQEKREFPLSLDSLWCFWSLTRQVVPVLFYCCHWNTMVRKLLYFLLVNASNPLFSSHTQPNIFCIIKQRKNAGLKDSCYHSYNESSLRLVLQAVGLLSSFVFYLWCFGWPTSIPIGNSPEHAL